MEDRGRVMTFDQKLSLIIAPIGVFLIAVFCL